MEPPDVQHDNMEGDMSCHEKGFLDGNVPFLGYKQPCCLATMTWIGLYVQRCLGRIVTLRLSKPRSLAEELAWNGTREAREGGHRLDVKLFLRCCGSPEAELSG